MRSGSKVIRVGWLSVLALLLITVNVKAQKSDSARTVIPRPLVKTVPLQSGELNVAVERFHRSDRSLQYGVGYIYKAYTNSGYVGEPSGEKVDGISLRLAYRNYREKRLASPQGGYHGPLATYRYMAFPDKLYSDQFHVIQSVKLKQQVFSLQYMLGMQRVFKKWFVIDAYAGLGGRLKYATQKDSGSDARSYLYRFYGKEVKSGSDWLLLAGPSFSFNIAIGVVI